MNSMPAPEKPSSLRVASYNLRGLKDDTAAAAAVVRAIDPDVLLLQEVPRYPGSDYALTAFARSARLFWSGRTRRVSGTSLMTSIRVLATDSQDRPLKVGLGRNPRSYTIARVQRPGGPRVTVVSVHLPLDAGQRVDHSTTVVRELADDVAVAFQPDLDDSGPAAASPLVVGGDLNEESSGRARAVLSGRLAEVTDRRPTFPAARPRLRIDAIFADGHRAATPGTFESLDETVGSELFRAASDHLPVWADLQF